MLGLVVAADDRICQDPGVHAGASNASALFFLVFFRPRASRIRLVSCPSNVAKPDELADLIVKPPLADFQGRELPLSQRRLALGPGLDVFNRDLGDREQSAEPVQQSELPLPAGFGGRRMAPVPDWLAADDMAFVGIGALAGTRLDRLRLP